MADLRFKLCPKCNRLKPVGNGSRLCAECADDARRSRQRKRDYKREYEVRKETEDPKYRRFYRSKEWQATSRQYMVEAGHKCEECGSIGTDVHHIAPIQTPEGWKLRFAWENLELLCVKCHNKRHQREFGAFHK